MHRYKIKLEKYYLVIQKVIKCGLYELLIFAYTFEMFDLLEYLLTFKELKYDIKNV